jgi:hypothetical protein
MATESPQGPYSYHRRSDIGLIDETERELFRKGSFSEKLGYWKEKHSVGLAFTISSLALLILSPLAFFLGTASSFTLHYYNQTKIDPNEEVISMVHSVAVSIGAVAAFLAVTPLGAGGGIIFHSLPFLAASFIGSALYNGTQGLDDSSSWA